MATNIRLTHSDVSKMTVYLLGRKADFVGGKYKFVKLRKEVMAHLGKKVGSPALTTVLKDLGIETRKLHDNVPTNGGDAKAQKYGEKMVAIADGVVGLKMDVKALKSMVTDLKAVVTGLNDALLEMMTKSSGPTKVPEYDSTGHQVN